MNSTRNVDGKILPGRKKHGDQPKLRKWFNKSSVELFCSAAYKTCISMMMANIRNEQEN